MKKYVAEFIGTFTLVLFGCGAASISNGIDSPIGILGVAFAFGLSIVAMAYSIGNISGCHVNPAVSLGAFMSGRMDAKEFGGYLIAQFLGATAGAGVLLAFQACTTYVFAGLGTDGYGKYSVVGLSLVGAALVEVILTFIFVLVFLGVTSLPKLSNVAGIVIGLTLTLIHILGIPLTGTSVNPARSFGPAVVDALAGNKDALIQLPIFIIAPLVGGALAAITWEYLTSIQMPKKTKAPTTATEFDSKPDAESDSEPDPESVSESDSSETTSVEE